MNKYTCPICNYTAGWSKFLWADGTLRCPKCHTIINRVVPDVEGRRVRFEQEEKLMQGFVEGVYDPT